MRVLHLSTSDVRGGAARGAFWLHRALRERGVDSHMLVGRKYSSDRDVSSVNGVFAPLSERIRDALDLVPLRRYDKTDDSFWTLGWVHRRMAGAVDAMKPDVIHLHWTGAGFLPVGALRAFRQPMIWTLRDMWAVTGGCHYSAGCRGYEASCGYCPQLRSEMGDDVSHKTWWRKRQAWRDMNLTLVPISNWLADCVRRSALLAAYPLEVIPNGLDTGQFSPVSRDRARAAWGLARDKRYILFGAIDAFRDKRKGYRQFVRAMEILARSCWSTRAEILIFGDPAPKGAPALALPTRFLGRIDDDSRLAQLYTAADVMVVPSIEEAFGKTLVESMACETPVVAFDGTGPADIVAHRETGYLAKPFEEADLAAGIEWCLEKPERTDTLGRAARRRARTLFDIDAVAARYVDLYQRVLKEAP